MTCVVGVVRDGTVWVGGDSAGVAGYSLVVRADEKVFVNGPFVMGFTSSFRMGQLLRYNLTAPPHPEGMDADRYMTTLFVDAVRATLKTGGYATVESGRESGGTFLVGYRGGLYQVDSDFQVARPYDLFAAVGCGADIALGYLCCAAATGPNPDLNAVVIGALRAAQRYSAGVRGPFTVVKGACA